MSTTTSAPSRTGQGLPKVSRGRKIKNGIATELMWAAFVAAMIPLVWVLGTVLVLGTGIAETDDELHGRGGAGISPRLPPSSR